MSCRKKMERSFSSLPDVTGKIKKLAEIKTPVIAAVDGRCASGKTTLAEKLHIEYGWSVIHMDHFFLRPEQRTAERYNTPGENIDHERFLEEVLIPLRSGHLAEYRPFNCISLRLMPPVSVSPSPVYIVEGSYSCNKFLWNYYDLRIFVSVSPEKQMERIISREGSEKARVFREKWIPLEELYFEAYNLEKRSDYILSL